jgi:diguanylate cyclase (GGDEF)-like protein
MKKILLLLEQQSHTRIAVISLLCVVALGSFDYLTGPDVLVFYLFPTALVAWVAGWELGVLLAVTSTVALWLADWFGATPTSPAAAIIVWNAMMRLVLLLIVTRILSALRHTLDREKDFARTDHVTDLPNRRAFFDMAQVNLYQAHRYKRPLTVAHIDVDNFKTVNDRLGHSEGDSLLRLIARTLQRNMRAVDMVARLGGDEFAILLPETHSESAQAALARIQHELTAMMRHFGWAVTFSIGVVTFMRPPSTVDELLKGADDLMYEVKRSNKNAVKFAVIGDTLTTTDTLPKLPTL